MTDTLRAYARIGIRALLTLLILLAPVTLIAQAVDSVVAGVPTPAAQANWRDVVNILLTLALGLITPLFMRGLEHLSGWLKSQPAITKRVVVSVIPSAVSLVCAYLATHVPWFPWDPGSVNAMIATSLAFAVHAGDTAKAAKG